MFIADGQLIAKRNGNKNQKGSEPSDLVIGPISNDEYAANWAQFRGGVKTDAANYDTNDTINANDFPNI